MSSTNLQELNLNHNFLFPAALEDPDICRLVVECITGETVGELKVKAEYTKSYNPEFKCIRLDVYAKDIVTEIGYNLEMQNRNEYNLPLRSRYYQAQIDVAGLKPGEEYLQLKPLYVIFICNFDPFDRELYRYTFSMRCEESEFPLEDGVKRIFFNTKGKNRDEVPKILIDFLGYLNDSTDAYVERELDEKVKKIHERIKLLKQNRNVEKNYMHYLSVERLIEAKEKELEEVKQRVQRAEEEKQRAEEEKQRAEEALKAVEQEKQRTRILFREMLLESIIKLGTISKSIQERIEKIEDINILTSLYKVAINVDTIEQFEKQMDDLEVFLIKKS